MKRGKEEEEEPFAEGPFTPLLERLLHAKDVIHVHDTDFDYNVDEQLDKIKDGLRQISVAFLAIDKWRKVVVEQLEMLIRDTNEFAQRNPREEILFPRIAHRIEQICEEVASFLPRVFESWKKSKEEVGGVDDKWRKDVVDQLEMLIRDTNKFAQRNPREEILFPRFAHRIEQICEVFESWKKSKEEVEGGVEEAEDANRIPSEWDFKVASFLPWIFEWKEPKEDVKGGVEEPEDANRIPGVKEEWDFELPLEKYESMDDQIKSCFRCLSLFPENSFVRKRDLIYWWIGEGFVKPREEKTAEEVGEECFHKLLEYDLINPIFNKGSNRINGLILHPYIRFLAISAADENVFFSFDSQGKPTAWSNDNPVNPTTWSNDNPSRVCISGTEKIDLSPSNMVNLVSLFNVDVLYLNFEMGVANNLNNLTVLQLGRWRSFPKHNNKSVNLKNFLECLPLLKSLRYLGLQDTYGISELPDKISNLSSLTVLDLGACHDLERLPSTISELKSLTHLDVSDCEVLQSLPFEVRNLELQVMKGLVIGNSISNTSLTNLKQWDKLRKLSINFGNNVEIGEVELGGVEHLRSLTTLIITWWVKNRKQLKTSTWNLDWLPECLEKLDLRCFPLDKLPSGLVPSKLKNLKRLYLRGGKLQSLEGLKVEGQEWQVEFLRLRYLIELKEDWFSLSRVFPGLKYVEIDKCKNIKPFPTNEWPTSVIDGALDEQQKSCLLCLSIFPENFNFSRRNVVYWWIGEGLVEPTGDKTAEHVGEGFLFKFIEMGLIEPITKESTGTVAECRLSHIGEVVCHIGREKQFFTFDSDQRLSRKCLTTSDVSKSVSFSLTNELGCVINLNVRRLCLNNDATSTIKNLTVLDLGAWSKNTGAYWTTIIENLESLFECLHLLKRLIYLGLAGVYGMTEIPDSISELSELRVLNLRYCLDLYRLSNEVVQLKKLTHLNMSGSSLRHIPMKLNDLEELQVVKGFWFTDSVLSNLSLSNLDKWKKLQKLSITFCDPRGTSEWDLAGVKTLLSLRSLSIVFRSCIGSAVDLCWLPPNLEKLVLIGLPLRKLPPQVMQKLSNLKRLYLERCDLHSLGIGLGLKVQVLRLSYLYELKLDWSEVRRIFPDLKYVIVDNCRKLTSFPGGKNGVWRKFDGGRLHVNEAAEI